MKVLLAICAFVLFAAELNAQDIKIYEKGSKLPVLFPFNTLDSLSIDPCDTSIYDLTGCDLDIDTTILSVTCGNVVNVSSQFDGTPSFIKYTIYDSSGTVIFSSTGSATISFMLPQYGIYYGIVEVSCGDPKTGDEDESAFEIINTAPIADFDVATTFVPSTGAPTRNVSLSDFSQVDGVATFAYEVKERATGLITTHTSANPTFATDVRKGYDVTLVVTDPKGCSAYKTRSLDSIVGCQPKFDWSYSWCDPCMKDSATISVNFANFSEWSASGTPTYKWDFGDGNFSTLASPSHAYHIPCEGKVFSVRLTMEIGNPADPNYCMKDWETTITISPVKPEVTFLGVCCDGLAYFSTDATKGKWSTPGSMGIPKFPAVSKNIRKILGAQFGQSYRQYYQTPGTYSVQVTAAESEDHNRCAGRQTFTINSIECFNRNVKVDGTDNVDGYSIKYKLRAIALPFVHRVTSKIKARNRKKFAEVSTDFIGQLNQQDALGCYCATRNTSSSDARTNYRKSVASTATSGRFRIGQDKITSSYRIQTKQGTVRNYTLKIGNTPCDHPWFMFF